LLIAQSPSYTMVKKWSPFYVIGRHLGFFGAVTSDTLAGFEREGINLFSMVFGNAVGLVETRKGKLFNRGEVLAEVSGKLQAGDILLEKTPFRLTDKLIPGYWGHAAVWVGTEEELRQLGIWDNPVVARFRDEIREGRGVVEALRSGVEMNSLEHFLNIDSIGVLRKAGLSREERARTVIQALRQVGKPYDFNFDVESKGRVYCSKLVYLSYSGVDWPTRKSLGRTTFTPDDVAAKAIRDGALQLVSFYHDGSRVTGDPLAVMRELMGIAKGKQASLPDGAAHRTAGPLAGLAYGQ
ncbi:MAG: Poxvirus G6, partial [Geobacteraceae bacterium]|nr:Poxvirus G6 [Geobacteraceae bacterium]